jgi:hypothetical protein
LRRGSPEACPEAEAGAQTGAAAVSAKAWSRGLVQRLGESVYDEVVVGLRRRHTEGCEDGIEVRRSGHDVCTRGGTLQRGMIGRGAWREGQQAQNWDCGKFGCAADETLVRDVAIGAERKRLKQSRTPGAKGLAGLALSRA